MTKKIIFISFLILWTAIFMTAQAQNTSIGLRAGLNFANVSGDDVSNTKSKVGANFGALLTYSVAPIFGITGEINFTSKGNKYDGSDATTSMNYLEIPIYGAYYFGSAESTLRPKIFAGPAVGILMTANHKAGSFEIDTKDFTEPVEFSAVLGLGFNKRIGEGNWVCVDVRYSLGLTNTDKNNDFIVNPKPIKKNNVISLNLAYTFPLGNN
jgi:hypothetical protein